MKDLDWLFTMPRSFHKKIVFYISIRRKSTIFVLHVCVLTSTSYYRIVSNPVPWLSVSNGMAFLGMLHPIDINVVFTLKTTLRACLHVAKVGDPR